MTSSELRTFFLERAHPVVESMTNSATGNTDVLQSGKAPHVDTPSYNKVWDLAKLIIADSNDIVKLELKTAEGCIDAVGKGKMTFDQAMQFMSLLEKKQDIELMPELIDKMEALKGE